MSFEHLHLESFNGRVSIVVLSFVLMNEVKCHRCGVSMPLESARPRGPLSPGFICPACFGTQVRVAFATVGIMLAVLLLIRCESGQSNQKRTQEIYNSQSSISYTQGTITTDVRVDLIGTVGYSIGVQWHDDWYGKLFQPLDTKLLRSKLQLGSDLCTPGTSGRVESQSSDSVKILVRANSSCYFYVHQKRNAAAPIQEGNRN